jgi:hypothetical protein
MTDLIRCPACRGGRKVYKLGGIVGECDFCVGTGKIKACDKPVPVIVSSELTADLIKATVNIESTYCDDSDIMPVVENIEPKMPEPIDIIKEVAQVQEPIVKTRKVFKRKKSA